METLKRRNLINFAALNEENKKKSSPLFAAWQPFPFHMAETALFFLALRLLCARALSGGAVSFSPESRIAFYIISRGGIFRVRSALARRTSHL